MSFLNETLHPEAEDLTKLLFTAAGQDEEERCYDVINALVMGTHIRGKLVGRTTEAGADLYSRIVESDYVKYGKAGAVSRISRCLWASQRAYPHG
jgi:hypothetical protein